MITPADSAPQRPAQMAASGWDIQAPYAAGEPSPIQVHGDADAGGRDDVAATVAEAMSNAQARYHEHESDTYGQGSTIGDLMAMPPSPVDPPAGPEPAGAYYDPPRNYGG